MGRWPSLGVGRRQHGMQRPGHPAVNQGWRSKFQGLAQGPRRNRRAKHGRQRRERVIEGPAEALLAGACEKRGQECVVGSECCQQFVQIEQVAKAPIEIRIEKKMHRRMEDAVDRRKHTYAGIGARFRIRPKLLWIGTKPAPRWTNRMVHVYFELPAWIQQRRYLVRPLAG